MLFPKEEENESTTSKMTNVSISCLIRVTMVVAAFSLILLNTYSSLRNISFQKLAPHDPVECNVSTSNNDLTPRQNTIHNKTNVTAIKTNGDVLSASTRVIVQYGKFRTASTFQFQALCLSMFVKILEQDNKTLAEQFSCRHQNRWAFDPTKVLSAPTVIKTHFLNKFPKHDKVWLFLTASDEQDINIMEQEGKSRDYDIKYVEERRRVEKVGLATLYDYQEIFQLNDNQMEQIVVYMKYWEVLRKCCGRQMSEDWRYELWQTNKPDPGYKLHHGRTSPSYPACHMYNISEVEKLYLNTSLVKSLSEFANMRNLTRPAGTDDDLDGTYCSRYNNAVAKYGLLKHEPIPLEI